MFSLDETGPPSEDFPVHILEIPTAVNLGPQTIEPGEYLLDDVSAAHLLVLAGAGTMEPVSSGKGHLTIDGATESVLFMRAGGFGDLVLLTPVLREHKRRYPDAKIGVCTMPHYAPVLAGLPYIDEILPYPLTTKKANEWDRWVFYENAIERNPRAEKIHATELFAEIAGLEFIPDLLPEYRVKATEAIWATEAYPRIEARRCCIAVGASARARIYPRELMGQVIAQMLRRGWEVFLLGTKNECQTPDAKPPRLKNLAEHDLSFRQCCAVVNGADVLIGNDSALLHIAGALSVPAVGLYGPFPYKLRTAHCPTTFSIQGDFKHKPCPCFHHVNAAIKNHFPNDCPTKATGNCGVLASIPPDRIVAKAEQIARTIPVPVA